MLETERLILRRWETKDLRPFAEMNSDLRVMEFFPSILTKEESLQFIERMKSKFKEDGFSFCAMELKDTGDFLGFVGLSKPGFKTHFTPCVEIGWRLPFRHWGKGFASEGARAFIRYGFDILSLNEIVSFTAVMNLRSRKVMERIGMTYDSADDFNHPNLGLDHPLSKHVLCRVKNPSLLRKDGGI